MIEAKQKAKDEAERVIAEETSKRQQQIQTIKDEIRTIEADWQREKDQLTQEWSAKLQRLKDEHAEIERRNEDAKRMKDEEYQRSIEQLRRELDAEERQKRAALSRPGRSPVADRSPPGGYGSEAEGDRG
jgi:serologically defined colon cancer antigen 8